MSNYLHRIKAQRIVEYLDLFEPEYTIEDLERAGDQAFDDWVFRRLMEDLRDAQPSGHLDTDLNTAWLVFRAGYKEDPRSALDPARRLQSLLIERYALNRRLKFYEDSNTIVLDGRAFFGLDPEQFRILEYLWGRGPLEWTRVRDMEREIDLLHGLSERTIRRFINDPDLCPEIRGLIEERPGKGHRLVLPPIPGGASDWPEVPEPVK